MSPRWGFKSQIINNFTHIPLLTELLKSHRDEILVKKQHLKKTSLFKVPSGQNIGKKITSQEKSPSRAIYYPTTMFIK
jgi:hypothetical protein